jgi:glycosyltransferase involved in cell wall biosynthesis
MASYLMNRQIIEPRLSSPDFHEYDIKNIVTKKGAIKKIADSINKEFKISVENGDLDLLVGGPPCQGFSGIGHRRSYSVDKEQLPSNHLYQDMAWVVNKLKPIQNKLQYYLCGFDVRGVVTEINQETGEQKQRPIRPDETVWARYEELFTDNYKIISEDYKSFLMKFEEKEFLESQNENYVRVWTRPVNSYAKNYSKFDISLAPIKNHMFNRMKSQLKVIEAGFYKKALIASQVGPYTLDLKHALNQGQFTNGNALLVSENNNHSDWAKNIKKLVDNPNMIEDLGNQLYETVKDKYSLVTVSIERSQFYKSII